VCEVKFENAREGGASRIAHSCPCTTALLPTNKLRPHPLKRRFRPRVGTEPGAVVATAAPAVSPACVGACACVAGACVRAMHVLS
jgi:hypothetical protein